MFMIHVDDFSPLHMWTIFYFILWKSAIPDPLKAIAEWCSQSMDNCSKIVQFRIQIYFWIKGEVARHGYNFINTSLETMRSTFAIIWKVLFCHMLTYPASNGEVMHRACEPHLFSISKFTRLSDAWLIMWIH